MNEVQRKYKILRFTSRKGLEEGVNELIQREYKDKDGFLYQSSGRWQCLGTPFLEKEYWHQAVVFIQEEDWLHNPAIYCRDLHLSKVTEIK